MYVSSSRKLDTGYILLPFSDAYENWQKTFAIPPSLILRWYFHLLYYLLSEIWLQLEKWLAVSKHFSFRMLQTVKKKKMNFPMWLQITPLWPYYIP